jgi:DNA-binding SARP family transcriptional activator
MPHLALYLLGPPRIECDGTALEVDTRKAIALLVYLAVTRQRHSRDALSALLWPEYDQAHARAALRRTLSTLSKALAGEYLDTERETVGLRSDADLLLDLDLFYGHLAECRTHGHAPAGVCPACVPPLTAAADLYRDDFMAGFTLRDSPDFDDWQFFQGEALRRDLASALERLVQCLATLGDFDAAIGHARRWLGMDRLHEPAHRQLMQLYAWSGQRAAALHQYRECARVLEQELGVAPLETTTQLYEAIKENRTPPPPTTTGPKAGEATEILDLEPSKSSTIQNRGALWATKIQNRQVPLVGRSAEWQSLQGAFAGAGESGHLVILQGEAGIGKTRLAREFMAYAGREGATAVAARCYEGETGLAYAPVIAILRAALANPESSERVNRLSPLWLSEAARLIPELGAARPDLPAPTPLESPGAQTRFYEGIRQVLLAAFAGDRPGVILVDDAHWADGASLDLLTYLVRRLGDNPFFLILTWRSEYVSTGPRLRHLLTEALRTGQATVLTLARLDRAAAMELLQPLEEGPAGLPVELVERLYAETEGLPYFLVEYMAVIGQDSDAALREEWSFPEGVRDLLHSRLQGLSETGWQLLTTAAVTGRSFDFDTLREASGRGEEEAVTGLEELISHGLVVEATGGAGNSANGAPTYDFSHEKLRALVYEETSLARRRLLHRRVAEALSARAPNRREVGSLAGQVAHHYQLAGNEATAAEFFKLAGEHARALYANEQALAHLRAALALGHPDTSSLHEAIGDLHTLLGEYRSALNSYETAAARWDSDDLARVEHKLANVYQRRGEWELAESHLRAALDAIGGSCDGSQPGAECAGVYADLALTAHRQGDISRALDLANRALNLAEASTDPRALAQAHNILGILYSSTSDFERAQGHLHQSLELAEKLNDPGVRAAALNNLALAYGAAGDTPRALDLARSALALASAQGDRHREAALHNNMADLLHAARMSQEAMLHLKEAVKIYAEIGVEAGTVQPAIWKLTEW